MLSGKTNNLIISKIWPSKGGTKECYCSPFLLHLDCYSNKVWAWNETSVGTQGKNWLIPNLIINTGLKWEVKWVMKGKRLPSQPPLTKPRARETIEYPQDRNVWSSSRCLTFYWQFIIKCSEGSSILWPAQVHSTSVEPGPLCWYKIISDNFFYKVPLSCIWHPNRSRSTPLLMTATNRVLRFILS